MSTLLRQRTNYLPNPRGRSESGILLEARRNLFPDPRATNGVGSLALATNGAVTGPTGTNVTLIAGGTYPGDCATARRIEAASLGPATTDYVGDWTYTSGPALTAGTVLTASAYVRRMSGANTKRVSLVVEYLNAANAVLATASASQPLVSVGGNPPSRLKVTTAAAPVGTTRARIWVRAEGAGGSDTAQPVAMEYSAVLVEAGTTVRPWFAAHVVSATPVITADGDQIAWASSPNGSASVLTSAAVEVTLPDGTIRRAPRPTGWLAPSADAQAVRDSAYRWNTGAETVVRIQPPGGGGTVGPLLYPDNDANAPAATYPATLVVVARRETPGALDVAIRVAVNGAAPVTAAVTSDEWATYRIPVTLNRGGGMDPVNSLRLGKNGTTALLVQAVAVVDSANYVGPYFDGDSPSVGVLASAWVDPVDAPNSASYQGIPSVTVTAAAEPDATPPGVTVTVTDADTINPLREVKVLRVDSSGRRTPVRARAGDTAELAEVTDGTAVVLHDSEVPYGESVAYILEPATSSEELYYIGSTRVTVDSDRAWLVHPGVPARSRPLAIVRLGSRRRRVVEGVYDVVGRGDPIVRTDGRRKSAESALVVRTYTDAEREALDLLLDDTSPLLLNIPPSKGLGVTYEWVAIGDSDEDRTAPAYGRWPRREWPLPYRVVGRPIGGTRSARTWHDVAREATTWADLARQHATWADVADPTTPPGG